MDMPGSNNLQAGQTFQCLLCRLGEPVNRLFCYSYIYISLLLIRSGLSSPSWSSGST
eukprot:c10766_g1_i1 orf=322-492(+)